MDISKLIRDGFRALYDKNKKIEAIYKKLANHTATYEEAAIFSQEMGKMLSEVLGSADITGIDIDYLTDYVLVNSLRDNYGIVSGICEAIQQDLNAAAGIGLNAVVPEINMNRIEGFRNMLMSSPDTAYTWQQVTKSVENFTESIVDDSVKKNADFQKKAGLGPVLIRKYEGPHFDPHRGKGGKGAVVDCDYCKNLEGVFEYGSEPKDFYKRHDGCRCIVKYYPTKDSAGWITSLAKGEKDVDQVLWNTGVYTSSSRKAVLARRRNQFGAEEARKILNAEWKNGLNGQSERHFT